MTEEQAEKLISELADIRYQLSAIIDLLGRAQGIKVGYHPQTGYFQEVPTPPVSGFFGQRKTATQSQGGSHADQGN